MSKHQKEVRRERRKTERLRRSLIRNPQSAIRNGTAALAAAAAIAAGTSAYAAPVRFDNPAGAGHFDWFPAGGPAIGLDLMLDAASQTGVTGSADILAQSYDPGLGLSLLTDSGDGGQVEIGGPYGLFVLPLNANDLIPSGDSWGNGGYVYYPGFGSQLPEGQATYLGVRFDLGAGNQYAWIGVTRSGPALDAFAWGYETDPGVSIPAGAVPEPGTLALLAFGALGAISRRR